MPGNWLCNIFSLFICQSQNHKRGTQSYYCGELTISSSSTGAVKIQEAGLPECRQREDTLYVKDYEQMIPWARSHNSYSSLKLSPFLRLGSVFKGNAKANTKSSGPFNTKCLFSFPSVRTCLQLTYLNKPPALQ